MKYHHGNLKEKLIATAYQWITDNGTDGFSLRKIAKIANVSQTAPYRHYQSKEHFLAEVAQLGFENFLDNMKKGKRNSEPVKDLVNISLSYIDFGLKNKNIISLMFDYPLTKSKYPNLLKSANNSFAYLQEKIKILQKNNKEKTQINAIAIHAFTHGLLNIVQMNQRIDPIEKVAVSDFYKASSEASNHLEEMLTDFIKKQNF
jgi:AcrR family transcriptional regulator